MFLLVCSVYPAFGDYLEPTAQEQQLYNRLLADFIKLNVQKTDVIGSIGPSSRMGKSMRIVVEKENRRRYFDNLQTTFSLSILTRRF